MELQHGIFALKMATFLCAVAILSGMTRGFADALLTSAGPLWRSTTKWAVLCALACVTVVLLHRSAPNEVAAVCAAAMTLAFVGCSASTAELVQSLRDSTPTGDFCNGCGRYRRERRP